MSKQWQPEALFDVLCSDRARRILVAAEREPRSASELAEVCDTSLPTIYRRVEALVEHDLLEEDLRIDPSGNHYNVYAANFEGVRFAVESERFTVDVELKRDLVDRFGALWGDLETGSGSSDASRERPGRPNGDADESEPY